VSSAPGISEEGLLTGTSTPIEMGKGSASGSEDFRFTTKKIDRPLTGGPKTDPLPPWLSSASSSASGVAMPGTPPVLEPLHQEVAPDTQRDEQLAVRAERRRWGVVLLIAAVIGTFAVGGFLIGRRESRAALENPPTTAAVTATLTTPPAPTNALTSPGPSASAPPTSASAATSAAVTMPGPVEPAASASAAAPALKPIHRPRKPKPAPTEGEPKPEEPTTAPNPYDPPAP
jgi:hypothetical protein